MPLIGPHFAEVCSKGEYGPPDQCKDWDAVTAFALWLLIGADEHNGLMVGLTGIAVAVFTGFLWSSTEKLWTQGNAALVETRSGERAWVTVAVIDTNLNINPDGMFFQVRIRWQNYGRTPAMDFNLIVGTDRYDQPTGISGTAVLGPGAPVTSSSININVNEAFRTKATYPIRCKVTYRDIFEETIRHSEVIIDYRYLGVTDPASYEVDDPGRVQKIISGFQSRAIGSTAD